MDRMKDCVVILHYFFGRCYLGLLDAWQIQVNVMTASVKREIPNG